MSVENCMFRVGDKVEELHCHDNHDTGYGDPGIVINVTPTSKNWCLEVQFEDRISFGDQDYFRLWDKK